MVMTSSFPCVRASALLFFGTEPHESGIDVKHAEDKANNFSHRAKYSVPAFRRPDIPGSREFKPHLVYILAVLFKMTDQTTLFCIFSVVGGWLVMK